MISVDHSTIEWLICQSVSTAEQRKLNETHEQTVPTTSQSKQVKIGTRISGRYCYSAGKDPADGS
ncbi:hypothetical protein T4D_131 [Trichinella pseudospiralis]|uniref:Uncharacterized protein n=1 Tax=Trichinella pseudospiralis TaxID=6337 RepID=A0A0V1FS96_TRIPS|nr:hypothetical protein T4D_131 [Trichinella pseudospiralis]